MEYMSVIEKLREGKELITKVSDCHLSTNESLKLLTRDLPWSISKIEKLQIDYIGIQSYYIEKLEGIRKYLEEVRENLKNEEIPLNEMIENINRFVKISKQSIKLMKKSLTDTNKYLRDNT